MHSNSLLYFTKPPVIAGGFFNVLKLRLVLIFILLPAFGFSQKPALTLQAGKYSYYQSFDLREDFPKDTLYARAFRFFTSSGKQFQNIKGTGDSSIHVLGQFLINKTAVSLSHPAGQVTYALTSEFKNNKFRYWLTSYMFSPFKRDRYGNFAKAPNQLVPLEKSPGKFNKAEWNAYLEATALQSKMIGENLLQFIKIGPQITPPQIPAKW